MNNVQTLFHTAVNADSKAERRNAFKQLREIALRGTGEEQREAREALQHSARYAEHLERDFFRVFTAPTRDEVLRMAGAGTKA